METFVVELNSRIRCLITGATVGTFLTVPTTATGLNPAAGRAWPRWSSEEERFETALENLSPLGQELASGSQKCLQSQVPGVAAMPWHRWPDSQ